MIRLKPDDVSVYISRGIAYYELGKYQLSIKDYNEAIRLKPDDDDAHYNRALAYSKLEQHQLAIENHNEAIRIEPDDQLAYDSKACSLAAQKKPKQACNLLKLAIKRGFNKRQIIKNDKNFGSIKNNVYFINSFKGLKK